MYNKHGKEYKYKLEEMDTETTWVYDEYFSNDPQQIIKHFKSMSRYKREHRNTIRIFAVDSPVVMGTIKQFEDFILPEEERDCKNCRWMMEIPKMSAEIGICRNCIKSGKKSRFESLLWPDRRFCPKFPLKFVHFDPNEEQEV